MLKLRSRMTTEKALVLCALSGMVAVTGYGQTATTTTTAPSAQEVKDKDVQKLEKFEVTGSRIKRIDTETVSPVVSYTAEQLDVQGFNTLGEALQAMPQNSGQVLTPTDSGTSFTPGVATINLRGLGNNNTLVLVNGRRSAPFASAGFNGFQTMFDFNSIPAGAIERIDILKDGASAIYGSDAVGGVVDIKLRKDYEGLSASTTIGNYFNTDGLIKKGNLLYGTHNGKTSITVAVDWTEQNATFARDVSYTANADKGADGTALQANPHYIVTGWQDLGYSSEAAYISDVLGDDILDPGWGWFDNRSGSGFPGRVYVTDTQGRGYHTFTSPTSTPTVAGSTLGTNYYNFQEVNGLDPWVRRLSFYTTAKHEFNEKIYAFTEVSFARSESEVHSAAAPASLSAENGLVPGSTMIIPSYNTYNPWAVDISSGSRRLVEAGDRISDMTSDTPRFLVGLGGIIDDFGTFTDWSWETGLLYTKNTVNNISRNAVPDYRLQEALMGLTRLGDGTLSWNPNTPTSDRVYFNWFGLNEQAFGDFLAVENPNVDMLEYKQFDARASGSVYQLPAGKLGLAFGFEHRIEKLESLATDLNATSNIIGGSAGTGFGGDRKVTSVYAEIGVPILKGLPGAESLEAQFAARYEDYSDTGFARQARPKIGLKYKPLDWLILRGSFTRNFKAPDLAYLYTASQTTFTSGSVYDPVMKHNITQLQVNVAGNRELKPELTDVAYAGFAIEPKGKLKGLQISVDGFRYQQKNLLTQLSDLYGYPEFLSEAASGNPVFADKVIRSSTTNEVLYIRDDYANISHGEYKGVDVDVDYLLKTNSLGAFNFNLMSTWIQYVSFSDENSAGGYLFPKWKGTANIGWRKGDWSANLMGVYYGKRTRTVDLGSGYDEGDEIYLQYTMDPRVVLNASVSYNGFHNTKVTLAISNLLNTAPAMDPMDQNGATSGAGYFNPAFASIRIEHKF